MARYSRPVIPIAWMTYLSPPYARLVEPPSSVVSERRADGSLFMAATDEAFDMTNAKHMAGARAIESVVDPLNFTVPFVTHIPWKDPTGGVA